ncbi:hypothetical protein DL96DRAFT_1013761 [Flagelloscypha sp. PMI_526]|nr:hypothetical protein DL96DRAFT_1013761 [Flagelloscypha sp. PMI_526]
MQRPTMSLSNSGDIPVAGSPRFMSQEEIRGSPAGHDTTPDSPPQNTLVPEGMLGPPAPSLLFPQQPATAIPSTGLDSANESRLPIPPDTSALSPIPWSTHLASDATPQVSSCTDHPIESENGRHLILCFDGTMNRWDAQNSNIVHLVTMLEKDLPCQKVYYQPGLGTYLDSHLWGLGPGVNHTLRALDAAFGIHLKTHILHGYEWLMDNYKSGDKISIFGFSRGAYTARALSGMLWTVGLLSRGNYQQVPFAYQAYLDATDYGSKPENGDVWFREAFGRHVEVSFLGLWDTVLSIGLTNNRLPFTTFNPAVHRIRHALSLDERRVKFAPSLWHTGIQYLWDSPSLLGSRPQSEHQKQLCGELAVTEQMKEKMLLATKKLQRRPTAAGGIEHRVKEVWFAGSHSDVGGGAEFNNASATLSRVSLRWMVGEILEAHAGVQFKPEELQKLGFPSPTQPNPSPRCRTSFSFTIKPPVNSIPPRPASPSSSSPVTPAGASVANSPFANSTLSPAPNPVLDEPTFSMEAHCLASAHCKLKTRKLWWLLEFLPFKSSERKPNGCSWRHKYKPHLGKPRVIPLREEVATSPGDDPEGESTQRLCKIFIHDSVRRRMRKSEYRPIARLTDGKRKEKICDEHPDVDWVSDWVSDDVPKFLDV